MNLIKYFGLQFILFCAIILTDFYLDNYLGKPFTYVDLLVVIIGASIMFTAVSLNLKYKERLMPIRSFIKILLSVLAIIIATIFVGALTGEMFF